MIPPRQQLVFIWIVLFFSAFGDLQAGEITLRKAALQDKIKGAWAGQTIGVTFGGPTEFRYRGTIIPDYQPLSWSGENLKWWFENGPGLYDDIYMDLTFVRVFEEQGLDAPASAHAQAFANAGYSLWHANQMARYNILHGLTPPASGNWIHNPHADDIDFEIESDFAGIMSPGMPNAAAAICDTVGHIMNYGDGWYGGVYIAGMYTLAFLYDDVERVVEEALQLIPEESRYYQTISDVIRWHADNPDDWKVTWFKTLEKWGEDVGCPDGVFTPFNIDAKMNSAWVVLGLLYGEGDFSRTLSIATRAGDDSDCNPSNAGGILGTILGYENIPDDWKQGLSAVESLDFKYTTISLNDVYDMSYRHALANIKRNGGQESRDAVTIPVQQPRPVPLEQGFGGHYPVERRRLDLRIDSTATIEFTGIGFAATGGVRNTGDGNPTLRVRMTIDNRDPEIVSLPADFVTRRPTPFWRYRLPPGRHRIRFEILNPTATSAFRLDHLIVYDNRPAQPAH